MQLFLIGPSGSGKDTQAQLLSKKYNLKWVSIGDVLRKRSEQKDVLGLYIKKTINGGNLLEWEHLKPVLLEVLSKNSSNYIWTGFPRLLEQAIYFDEIIVKSIDKLSSVVNLVLDDNKTKERIEFRKNSSAVIREDDLKDELIEKRVLWYKESISLIKDYYRETDRFIEVNADDTIENVFLEICKNLKKYE